MSYNQKALVGMLMGWSSALFAILTISSISNGDAIASAFSASAFLLFLLMGLGEVQKGD